MDAKQFREAVALAHSDVDLSAFNDDILFGFGLPDFQPVSVPLEVAARCIRWQCVMMNGGLDQDALEECRTLFRRRVFIVKPDQLVTAGDNS